jgi:hypothetical protein
MLTNKALNLPRKQPEVKEKITAAKGITTTFPVIKLEDVNEKVI